jgi:serine/threonine-protein kinase RsbT
MAPDFPVEIKHESHVALARRQARYRALLLGFNKAEAEAVALIVSELSTNLLRHAGEGTLHIEPLFRDGQVGIQIESRDHGPGIEDVALAMQDGFSTAGGLGSGLPAILRLADDLEIQTDPTGTIVLVHKWLPKR